MEKFEHKKSLGQHFLNSDVVPQWMCDAAGVEEGDIVLEIGPGAGVLTEELLGRGAKVHAIEADQRAILILEKNLADSLASGELTIHHIDARELHLNDLPLQSGKFKVVANIPYYLSGMLFRNCLSGKIQPKTLVFLVQKEVAKRITEPEREGKQSLLSLSVSVYGKAKYVKTVSRGHFTPPPKIDSAIIKISDISKEKLLGIDEDFFFQLLHLGFGQKRKQLRSNLKGEFTLEVIEEAFNELNLSEKVRAEDIDTETWVNLAKKLSQNPLNKQLMA